MNVRPGGAQAVLHDTVWNGRAQNIVFSDSTSKGMKHIHKERELYTKGMKPKKCDTSSGQDVRLQVQKKTKVEKLISSQGLLPKFHYKLNPIECCWCHSKRYTWSHCDYTFPGLLATINNSLNSVTRPGRQSERPGRQSELIVKASHSVQR